MLILSVTTAILVLIYSAITLYNSKRVEEALLDEIVRLEEKERKYKFLMKTLTEKEKNKFYNDYYAQDQD